MINNRVMKLVIFFFAIATVSAQSCPEKDGLYPHPTFCDKYTKCDDGVPQEITCPDGLGFATSYTNRNYPCGYVTAIDCGERTQLQPAQPGEICPRQWGYYGSGDRAQCGYFYNCVNGIAHKIDCPEGLAFSSLTYTCVFAEESPDCDVGEYLGFTCPAEGPSNAVSVFGLPRYPSPRDCRSYFICLGQSARLQKCDLGHVYNPNIHNCDEPENVPDCIDYYPEEMLARLRKEREERRVANEARRQRLRELFAQRRQG